MSNTTITICSLVCAKKEKYLRRLKDFIEHYGIICKKTKERVKTVLLAEDEPRPSFIPKDVEWINFPHDPMSVRFTRYISTMSSSSSWIMQVDDDSSTDVDKTLEILDQYYDHKDPMVLMAGRQTDLEPALQGIAKTMRTPNFFFGHEDISKFKGQPLFTHSWGSTIISSAGIKKIREWTHLRRYIDMCKSARTVFGDQVPYLAAKIAKVPIVESTFMSPFSDADQYTAINPTGRYSHIHYIKEEWPQYRSFIDALKSGKKLKSAEDTSHSMQKNVPSTTISKKKIERNTKKPNHVIAGMNRLETKLNIPRYNNITKRR